MRAIKSFETHPHKGNRIWCLVGRWLQKRSQRIGTRKFENQRRKRLKLGEHLLRDLGFDNQGNLITGDKALQGGPHRAANGRKAKNDPNLKKEGARSRRWTLPCIERR